MCQVGSFFCKLFFLDLQHVDLAPLADPHKVAALLPLDSDQEAGALSKHTMTICTVHLHGLFIPKLDWNLQNLGKMCRIPGKPDRENACVLLLSLLWNIQFNIQT